jgi:hypothetical protein
MHNGHTPHKKSELQTALGYGIAVAALVWVFHDISIDGMRHDIARVNWLLAGLGMLTDTGRYVMQSIRWRLLLKPLGTISFGKTFKALYAGVFLNLILPFRIGEVARAYLAARFASAPFPAVMSSLFTEYFIDGIWLAISIGIVSLLVPLPKEVTATAHIIGIVIVVVGVFFGILVLADKKIKVDKAEKKQTKLVKLIWSFIESLKTGVHVIGKSWSFLQAASVSSLNLVFHVTAFWLILKAYGIELSYVNAAAVLLFVFVGLIVPNAPSNVGSFQFLCVVGLMLFGIDKTTATGFSVLVFMLVTIPQLVIGWIAFAHSDHTLYDIKNQINRLRSSTRES